MIPEFGKIIGRGNTRICYLNPNNPKTCFKISSRKSSKETVREINFFNFLKQKGIYTSYLPQFFRSFSNHEIIGYEVELFWSKDGSSSTVLEFLKTASDSQIKDLETHLRLLKQELIEKNIIISDLATGNMAIRLNHDGKIERLVIIDGFGSGEMIPIARFLPFLGKQKIERKWKKFISRYQNDKNLFKKHSVIINNLDEQP